MVKPTRDAEFTKASIMQNAMMAVVSEVILEVIQSSVFVAIIIYAHQNKDVIK